MAGLFSGPPAQAASPVGYWKLDETTGNTAKDSSGYGHNGVLNGFAASPSPWVAGKLGNALSFDGIDDYVQFTGIPVDLAAGARNTVAFWMYWKGGNDQMPFGWQGEYNLWLRDGYFGFNSGESNILGISSAGLAKRWVHVVAVFANGVPSPGTVELYLDGVKQGIAQARGSTTLSRSVDASPRLSGCGSYSKYRFGGMLDELRIYNRALSQAEVTELYTIPPATIATPSFSPAAGTYASAQSVTIACSTSGAAIHYTLDGSTPTESSATYASPIAVSTTTTIKAGAWKSGMTPSAIASATYTITPATVATPSFSPAAGAYPCPQFVTISTSTPGALIRFTRDGSIPGETSEAYLGPIAVTAAVTLRACAWKSGMAASDAASATYALVPVGRTLYVALSGDNSRTGTAPDQAWRTITWAASKAQAGDIVYIKAGDYGRERVVVAASGNSTAPIVFMGYKDTPGDVPAPAWIDLHKTGGHAPPVLDATAMPLISGQGPSDGRGISADGRSFVQFWNLQIRDYGTGLLAAGSHLVASNVKALSCYDGIYFDGCDNSEIRNCAASDCDMSDIVLVGPRYCLVENCHAHDAAGGLRTDYYIPVLGYTREAYGNTIRHCYAQNDEPATGQHAFNIQGDTNDGPAGYDIHDNTFIECVSRNGYDNFLLRDHFVFNNRWENCTVYGNGQNSFGYQIANAAHDNTFVNCRSIAAKRAVLFLDSGREGINTSSGKNNLFSHCLFQDSLQAITYYKTSSTYDTPALDNTFLNCVFAGGGEFLVEDTNGNSGNALRNCIVTGFTTFRSGSGSGGLVYSYCDFHGNSFVMPAGTGNLAQDPKFADAAAGDFHLKSSKARWNGIAWVQDGVDSPCIGAGDPASDNSKSPWGRTIEMGIYGNTAEASKGN